MIPIRLPPLMSLGWLVVKFLVFILLTMDMLDIIVVAYQQF